MKISNILLFLFMIVSATLFAKPSKPPVQGEITDGKEPIAFATVQLKSTTTGSASDISGKYILTDIPEGEQTLIIKALGYKSKEMKVNISYEQPITLNITLEEDVLGLEQIVVTADKKKKTRIEASAIVNTMTPKSLNQTQSVTLSEGLNYTPGLRTETNCQNCGAGAVRMNGMDGSYSQVLINGRPIFSGLASVYGLEMIPANMIQQLEIVKGGGSALYGGNAIAGTINLITKEPINNNFQASIQEGIIGLDTNPVNDLNINANTSVVSEDKNSGLSLYATHRDRDGYDANGDGFTELAELDNTTFGVNIFHRMGYRNKLTIDYFNINEERRGGDMLDEMEHEANIAESIKHKINTASLNFSRFVGDNGQLSVYIASQYIDRWTYYGARSYDDDYVFDLEMDDPDQLSDGTPDYSSYGSTNELSYSYGVDYKGGVGRSSYIFGIENNGADLLDEKLGYTDEDGNYNERTTVSDQTTSTIGLLGQYDYEFNKITLSAGARLDHYKITDNVAESDISKSVFSPRMNILYKPTGKLQLRASYSSGYRAPQIFDEDLHIETSGSRSVTYENDDDLTQETSHSLMASFDYQTKIGSADFEIMAEGFYTLLQDAFAYEMTDGDDDGEVIYTRYNSDEAYVQGINIESRFYPSANWNIDLGFTIQSSEYSDAQEYGDGNYTKSFLKTPKSYGYFTFNTDPIKNLTLSANGSFTGPMTLEYYGTDLVDQDAGELRESDSFFDAGFKAEYFIRNNKGFDMSIACGMKNIFNSYQDDFDTGINRDPGYIYGPAIPRSIYFTLKLGSLL
jgi:outer membrane receptor for ferrienterochelin and colicins